MNRMGTKQEQEKTNMDMRGGETQDMGNTGLTVILF